MNKQTFGRKPGLFLRALPGQVFPWNDPWHAARVDVIDQYDLSAEVLQHRKLVLTTMHQDQRWLASNQAILENFVEDGGTLVVHGQVAIPYLDVLSVYQPVPRPTVAQMQVRYQRAHPIFEGIAPETLNNRKGVAGFFTRGQNPPPEGAVILTSMADGTVPVDWVIDKGKGRVFTHSGNDLWVTFERAEENLAFSRQLIEWSLNETVSSL